METQNQHALRLLPHYFKAIGKATLFISLLILFSLWKKHQLLDTSSYHILSTVFWNLAIIGLLFQTIAKEKIEDEMTNLIRLRAYVAAFVFGVILLLIDPIIQLSGDELFAITETKSQWMLINILFVYRLAFKIYTKKYQ